MDQNFGRKPSSWKCPAPSLVRSKSDHWATLTPNSECLALTTVLIIDRLLIARILLYLKASVAQGFIFQDFPDIENTMGEAWVLRSSVGPNIAVHRSPIICFYPAVFISTIRKGFHPWRSSQCSCALSYIRNRTASTLLVVKVAACY